MIWVPAAPSMAACTIAESSALTSPARRTRAAASAPAEMIRFFILLIIIIDTIRKSWIDNMAIGQLRPYYPAVIGLDDGRPVIGRDSLDSVTAGKGRASKQQ